MTEMERVYVNWALGPGGALTMVWGEYVEGNPEWDFASEAGQLDESMRAWKDECVAADQRIASYDSPGEVGLGNGRSVR